MYNICTLHTYRVPISETPSVQWRVGGGSSLFVGVSSIMRTFNDNGWVGKITVEGKEGGVEGMCAR